jgi:outer membrane protein assembly factor BamD (BamD/ComL family)
MPEKQTNSKSSAAPKSADSVLEYLKDDFFPKHGTKVIIILLLIVVGIFIVSNKMKDSAEKEAAMAEELGKGLDYIYAGKTDSALMVFEAAIQNGSFKDLPLAKAALLAGNIHLQNSNLETAETLYGQAISNSGKVELISAAAEHGLAVVAMEKTNYPEAISLLNAFINKYGKRTGDLTKRYMKTEPVDKVPNVPDALWKLTLCYLETGDKENSIKTAEKLLKIYGDSQKAADALKLLAALEK